METLLELRTSVRDRLAESIASQWLDPMLNRWINEGLQDVARRTETLQDWTDIAATVGLQQYTLPSNIIRVYRTEWRPTSGQVNVMEYRDFNNMDSVWWGSQTTAQSTPVLFTMWGFPPTLKMIVYPSPASAGSFRVYHYRLPAVLASDTAIAEIPEGWTDLVVSYCEYMALRRDRDPRWQEAKSLYEQSVEQMLDMTRRWTDQAGMIDTDSGTPLLHPFITDPGWY